MSGSSALAAAVQLAGLVAAPALPGAIQHVKGRLQGRPGPSVLQPYRELRRLWGKSAVAPEPRTFVYELAPAIVAGSLALTLVLLPIAGDSGAWSLGNDALVVVGLLALGRFAITLAAWDTAGGFGLMGASRDLTIAVAAEAVLLLVFALLALGTGTTDLLVLSASARDSGTWAEPAHWAAALAFLLVTLAETGRQPIDNPDTHLELTMIHEGPLLEYAGRDLAYLQWAAAARHWVMLVLATELFIPHPGPFAARLAILAAALVLLCIALALVETAQAKMRILQAPLFVGAGGLVCLLGLVSWFAGGGA